MSLFGRSEAYWREAGAEWTAREVLQQPQLWEQIHSQMAAEALTLQPFLDAILERADARVVLTGAGTSAYIGQCLAPALAASARWRIEALATTDLVASPSLFRKSADPTLLVSFARSGNSPESVAAVELADACLEHAAHLIVTCNCDGLLAQWASAHPRAHVLMLPERSNDQGFAMTSSFTGMLLAGALALKAPMTREATAACASAARQVLAGFLPLVEELIAGGFERVVYLGSRELKGLANEAALKMLELTDGRVAVMADSPLGFRHGPKTFLNSNTLVVLFSSNDQHTHRYEEDLLIELRREKIASRVIALSAHAGAAAPADDIVLGPAPGTSASDLQLCLPYAVFAQALALCRSLSLGLRPDQPNAAGTVSRVVRGVRIHRWPERR